MKLTHWTIALLLLMAIAAPAQAQGNATPRAPARQDDPDMDMNFVQPDFTLLTLPTTLRVPRHKGSFRVTHRFGRPLGSGDFGDLAADLFGLDAGAQIGLEYRFGLFRATQIGIHRTSDRTIQFFAEREVKAQSGGFPVTIAGLASIEGTQNFGASGTIHSYSPALGVVLSREVAQHAAFYVEPIWVNNTNPLPSELIDDNDTVFIGLGTRLRVRPTVYIVFEALPKVSGHNEGASHVSFGVEKRAGGHLFQLNFSNGVGTTFAQIARGGTNYDDWYLGFNISRKFF